ncbi:MAG: hypothetical protein IKV94_01355 [Clostridia bacterium]|nr:hypothetical protein [Clostridia bacterium]
MKKIEIEITDKKSVLDKFNSNKISSELLDYIIVQCSHINKKDDFQIVINKKVHIEDEIDILIKEGIKEAYLKSWKKNKSNNMKQILFFIAGVSIIAVSTLLEENSIWKELLLITGWVPIWEMIEMEIFTDVRGRRMRKLLKRIMQSEIILKEDDKK